MGKIVKLKNKKTGVRVYPVTATSAVVDANSGERLNDTLQNKVEEAPMDGNQYVRTNGVWSVAQMATSTKEKCIITLASNQGESDAASIYGATVKVTDVDSAEVYHEGVWDGTEIALEFAPGVNYKVEVGAVADYATPESKTLTALEFNVRNVVMTYKAEIINVSLSSDTSTDVSGQTVTINNAEYVYDGVNPIVKKVPFGLECVVSVNQKKGYFTPDSLTFIASQNERNIDFVYTKIQNGVYYQSIDGKLYSESEWDGTKTLNGYAIITDNCSFVMAKTNAPSDAYASYLFKGTIDGVSIEGLTLKTTLEEAVLDFNGRYNTEKMIELWGDEATAAKVCSEYVFPNGQTGYLGSAGEWYVIMNNYETLVRMFGDSNSLITSMNGVISSTLASADLSHWRFFPRSEVMSTSAWHNSGTARALTELTGY